MNEQEKARELVERFLQQCFTNPQELMMVKAKQCALICVEEIIKTLKKDSDFTTTY